MTNQVANQVDTDHIDLVRDIVEHAIEWPYHLIKGQTTAPVNLEVLCAMGHYEFRRMFRRAVLLPCYYRIRIPFRQKLWGVGSGKWRSIIPSRRSKPAM